MDDLVDSNFELLIGQSQKLLLGPIGSASHESESRTITE